jgi:hypothetical protein
MNLSAMVWPQELIDCFTFYGSCHDSENENEQTKGSGNNFSLLITQKCVTQK